MVTVSITGLVSNANLSINKIFSPSTSDEITTFFSSPSYETNVLFSTTNSLFADAVINKVPQIAKTSVTINNLLFILSPIKYTTYLSSSPCMYLSARSFLFTASTPKSSVLFELNSVNGLRFSSPSLKYLS